MEKERDDYSQGPDLRTHYKDGRAFKKEKDKKV